MQVTGVLCNCFFARAAIAFAHMYPPPHTHTQATFVVEVDAPSRLAVLSNAPSASTRWTLSSADISVSRVTFQPTPPMSTYLLSIAVGELKATSSKTKR